MKVLQLAFIALFCLLISFVSNGQIYSRSDLNHAVVELESKRGIPLLEGTVALAEAYMDFQLDKAKLYAEKALKLSIDQKKEFEKEKSQLLLIFIRYKQEGIYDGLFRKINEKIYWFKKHNHSLEFSKAYFFKMNALRRKKGINDLLSMDRVILDLVSSKDNNAIALAHFNRMSLRNMNENWNNDVHYLDTARSHALKAKNPVLLGKIRLLSILPRNGWPESFDSCHRTLIMAKKLGNRQSMIDSYNSLVVAFSGKRNIDSARFYFQKGILEAKKLGNAVEELVLNYRMANAFRYVNESDSVLAYFDRAFDLCEKFGWEDLQATVLRQMGNTLVKKTELSKAVQPLQESLRLARKNENEFTIYSASRTLCQLFVTSKRFEEADKLSDELLSWVKTKEKNQAYGRMKALVLNLKGFSKENQGENQQALDYYRQAKKESLELPKGMTFDNNVSLFILLVRLDSVQLAEEQYLFILSNYSKKYTDRFDPFILAEAKLMNRLGRTDEAISRYRKFLETSNSKEANESRFDSYESLSNLYFKKGNYKKAFENSRNALLIKLKIDEENDLLALEKLQSKYDLAQREHKIDQLENNRLRQKNKIDNQQNTLNTNKIYVFFLITTILLIIIIFTFIFRRIRDSKEKAELAKATLVKENRIQEMKTEESKRIVELKNQLFANISHEFRTPLTLIQAPVENLMKTANEKDTATLGNIRNSTDQLLVMVDEMLELAKLDTGNVTLSASNIYLSSFIYKIKAHFSDLFKQKNVSFALEMEEHNFDFFGDEHRLRIVLNNLLKNAYHHTPSGGKVVLSVHPNTSNDNLNVQLFNSGRHVEKAFLPDIFNRYARGEQENYSGYGIGLSLCKEIITLHKGSIDAKNVGYGVLFSFTIPTTFEVVESDMYETLQPQIINESTISDKKNKTILVVEDNYEIQGLLHDVLSESYQLIFADNGLQGVEAAKEHQPDLIISDIMMPVMEGTELTKELKEELATSHIPIILLTAKSTHQGKVEGLESGADDYLTKPFSPKEVIVRVKNLIQQRDLLKERFSKNVFLQAEDFTSNNLDREFLTKATDIVHQNLLNADFSVELFCRQLALNRNSVHQKLKSLTGLSASQFIRSIKLKKAAEYLLDDRLSMIEISEMAGFNSRQAFNKVFKEQFEMTPSNYRKTHSQK